MLLNAIYYSPLVVVVSYPAVGLGLDVAVTYSGTLIIPPLGEETSMDSLRIMFTIAMLTFLLRHLLITKANHNNIAINRR